MKKSQKTQLFEEKEGQYCSRFDIAIGGIIIHDLETGRMVEANPTACRMYNYTHEEFLGLLLTAFIHPTRKHGFCECLQAFRSDSVFVILFLSIYWSINQIHFERLRLALLPSGQRKKSTRNYIRLARYREAYCKATWIEFEFQE